MAGLRLAVDAEITFATLATALKNIPITETYTVATLVKTNALSIWQAQTYLFRNGPAATRTTPDAGLSISSNNTLASDGILGVSDTAGLNWLTTNGFAVDKDYIIGASVNAGGIPRYFFIDVATGTTVHQNGSNALGVPGVASTILSIAAQLPATDRTSGVIGLVGWWNVVLSDANKAALGTGKNSTAWSTNAGGAPVCLIECNRPVANLTDWAGNATVPAFVGIEPEVDFSAFSDWDFIAAETFAPTTIRTMPLGTGKSITTPATTWGFSAWTELVASMPFLFGVHGMDFQFTSPALTFGQDFTSELIIEIGIGAAGSEVTKLQLPYSVRADTALGYYLDSDERLILPELYEVPAGSRVSARLANNQALALNINGVNLFGYELASVTAVSDSDTGSGTETQVETAVLSSSDAGGDVDANVLKAVYTSADVNGTTTEAITQTAPYTQTDVNGTTTELGTVAQKYSSADTGTDAEANALTAAISQADGNGTTTETALVTFAVSSADVGSDIEAVVLAAAYTQADTGTDSGNEVAKIGLVAADTGSDVEAQALTAVYTSADTGTDAEASKTVITAGDTNGATTEAITLTVAITQADANASVNDVGVVGSSGNFTQADNSNPTVDAATFAAVLSTADTGSSTEAAAVSTPIAGSDSGTGTETAIVVAKYTLAETGSGSDTGTPKAVYSAVDAGSDVEAASQTVSFTGGDSGASTEPATLLVALSGLDVASDLELATQVAAFVAAEAGVSLDTNQITAKFILPDAGSGAETTAPLGLLTGDTATGIDAASLKVLISQIDAGFAVDTEIASSLSFFDPNAPHPHWIRATKIETPTLLSAGGDKPRTLIQFDDDPKLRKAGV